MSHVVIGLKTAKGTKQLKLDPSIYESLQKEKVEVGDVIYIEANTGAVKVGRWSCMHTNHAYIFVLYLLTQGAMFPWASRLIRLAAGQTSARRVQYIHINTYIQEVVPRSSV